MLINLSTFDLEYLKNSLKAFEDFSKQKLPEHFINDKIYIVLDDNVGLMFFRNSRGQTLVWNDEAKALEFYYVMPTGYHEGTAKELIKDYNECREEWDDEDIRFLISHNIFQICVLSGTYELCASKQCEACNKLIKTC